jgi:hypothetical protein
MILYPPAYGLTFLGGSWCWEESNLLRGQRGPVSINEVDCERKLCGSENLD